MRPFQMVTPTPPYSKKELNHYQLFINNKIKLKMKPYADVAYVPCAEAHSERPNFQRRPFQQELLLREQHHRACIWGTEEGVLLRQGPTVKEVEQNELRNRKPILVVFTATKISPYFGSLLSNEGKMETLLVVTAVHPVAPTESSDYWDHFYSKMALLTVYCKNE